MAEPIHSLSRRTVLKAALQAGSMAAVPADARAAGNGELIVADPGGPYSSAFKKAFYEPFQQATGITVSGVAHNSTPVAQVKAMVDAKALLWDVVDLSPFQTHLLSGLGEYLEPVGFTKADAPGMLDAGMSAYSVGIDVFATVIGYRTDVYPKGGPQNWADFWDVQRFPGRRAMRRAPQVFEAALMADGVAPDRLYPIDVDRAFRSLDRIRPHVAVWWANGAQSTQLIESGEVDMCWMWNGRAQAAIEGGAPVAVVWNQGLYELDVWAIPKGCKRLMAAQQFIRFASDPARQAVMTEGLAYGPANLDALALVAPARAPLLPTYKPNLAVMQPKDDLWWANNYGALTDRFNTWLIG